MGNTTAELVKRHPTGKALYSKVRTHSGSDGVLLAFSRGKDSIAAALALRDHFEPVVPCFLYLVPGLSFVEESLDYFERHLFGGRHIVRLPHPVFYRWMIAYIRQPPGRMPAIDALDLPNYDFDELDAMAKMDGGLPPEAFTATGRRVNDSVIRRMVIAKSGPINFKRKKFAAIWDWSNDQVFDAIRRAGIKLPVDYKLFGRSFDGVEAMYVLPIKRHFPEDYRRICEWFPLVEADVFRAEKMGL